MNDQNENPFIIDELHKELEGTPRSATLLWDIHIIFITEPRFADIAVNSAAVKWLWKKARITAFEAAMDKADKLIGKDTSVPRLQNNAAWDCFYNYVLDHMRL